MRISLLFMVSLGLTFANAIMAMSPKQQIEHDFTALHQGLFDGNVADQLDQLRNDLMNEWSIGMLRDVRGALDQYRDEPFGPDPVTRESSRVLINRIQANIDKIVKDMEAQAKGAPQNVYQALGIPMNATAYEILGLKPTATLEQIKKAYRARVKEWHPDKNKSPFARRAFELIQKAYEDLTGAPQFTPEPEPAPAPKPQPQPVPAPAGQPKPQPAPMPSLPQPKPAEAPQPSKPVQTVKGYWKQEILGQMNMLRSSLANQDDKNTVGNLINTLTQAYTPQNLDYVHGRLQQLRGKQAYDNKGKPFMSDKLVNYIQMRIGEDLKAK